MIIEYLTEFLESAKRYKGLSFPLRRSEDCNGPRYTANIEKYILALADAAPTKEPKFSAHRGRLVAHSEGASLNFLCGLNLLPSMWYIIV